MSTNTDTIEHDSHEHSSHLSDWQYIKIAIFLAVVTGIEVLTYFVDFKDAAVPVLLVLMVVKFGVVVAYFMHLRFDNPLFTTLFVSGLLLAVAVYVAVFLAFEFWTGWVT